MLVEDIQFLRLEAQNGKFIGRITLTRVRALNALSMQMLTALKDQLMAWQQDPSIAMILITSSNPKAFCAGGDIKALFLGTDDTKTSAIEKAIKYFDLEYTTDQLIHHYPKPVLAFLDGLVLGGGWGLIAGASHICATPPTQWAMPEISIGFFPDVGASWFLNRLPWGLCLWSALTGHRWTTTEAHLAGFVHSLVNDRQIFLLIENDLIGQIGAKPAPSDVPTSEFTSDSINAILNKYALLFDRTPMAFKKAPCHDIRPPSPLTDNPTSVWHHLPALQKLANNCFSFTTWLNRLENDVTLKEILTTDYDRLMQGSPLSAHVIFEQMRRTRSMSLSQCFQMDLQLCRKFIGQSDFAEGVRALLLDKDQQPAWRYKTATMVPRQAIMDFFN